MIQGHLRRFPRFDGLNDDQISTLERTFTSRRCRPGHTLMREGDKATGAAASMCLVLEGTVEIGQRDHAGKWSVKRVVGPGELIGVIALIRDTRRTATCKMGRKGLIARIDRTALAHLKRKDPATWGQFQHVVGLQLAADFRAVHARIAAAIAVEESSGE